MDQFTQLLSQSADSFITFFSHLNLVILLPIFGIVGGFLASYYKNYQKPAQDIRAHLTTLASQIREARGNSQSLENTLDGIFSMSPFRGLWSEYCTSLHVLQGGAHSHKAILSTVPSETFFSKEAVVDLHINADFYRHLPGILTGIGIIGTFSGLVWGLHQFKPDSSAALSSLPMLLEEVTSAFVGSGFAILAAIFVTFKEKSILNSCYRALAEVNREIDGLYAMGAGEEYLARLVFASENNVIAQEKQYQALSGQIATAIREALAQPMNELSQVVERVTAQQEQAIGSILDEVLKTFAGHLETTFGGQIEKINQSFAKASQSMEQVQQMMTVLLSDMASVGVNAVDQMSGTLAEAMENASVAQDRMNEQMASFIAELQQTLAQNQEKSSEVMDVTMRAVLAKLQAAITRLAVDRGEQIEYDCQRIETLTKSVAKLVESVDNSSARNAESLSILQSTASGAISGMNNGAVVMRMAADRFTMAGNTLSEALEKTDALSDTVSHLQDLLTSTVQLRRAG